jgi:hypothetical protein
MERRNNPSTPTAAKYVEGSGIAVMVNVLVSRFHEEVKALSNWKEFVLPIEPERSLPKVSTLPSKKLFTVRRALPV